MKEGKHFDDLNFVLKKMYKFYQYSPKSDRYSKLLKPF